MKEPEFLKHIPERYRDMDRLNSGRPYQDPLAEFRQGTGRVVQDDTSNFPVALARQMRPNSAAAFSVQTDGRGYPVQILKGESALYLASVGFRAHSGHMMDAHVHRPAHLLDLFGRLDVPFLEDLPKSTIALSFDVVTKIDGQYFPPFRAASFLPWAMRVLQPYRPTHVMTSWEPDSDNHAAFYDSLGKTGDPVASAKTTWSYQQLSGLGCELIPKIGIARMIDSPLVTAKAKISPHGNPRTVVMSMYTIGKMPRRK